ncbi:MAG: YfhO family protein [Patescibacteria group bacterium]|nr:YfhO family protein [Patescibacteria group bacterium]
MKLLKRFWPIIFIFCIWFIFSSPYFIKNKVPFASNYQVNFFSPWSTYPEFAGPVKNNAMPDVIGQIYPWKHFVIESWKAGQIPLWNPNSFSGTPLLANYQSAVLSPFNILFFILPFIDAWSILVLLQPLLAGIFMYLLMRALNVEKTGSLISAIAFMFCGFLTTWMGYATLGYAILFLPLAIYSIEKFYSSNKVRFLFLLSLTIPLSFFSGHFQISLYFFIFVVSYVVFKFFQTKNIHNTFYLILYTLFGVLFSLPQLLPSIELYSQTLRSALFQKAEIIPWGYLPTFIAPDLLGNPVTRNDWFGHYAEWNAYIGLVPLMLAFYSIMNRKITPVIFYIFSAILAIFLAFQTPVLDLLVFLHVPVLSTSAASRIIVIFSFSFAVLSGFGLDYLLKDVGDKKFKKIVIWLSGFAIIFAALWSVVILKILLPIDKIAIAKQNLILPTIIFVLFSLSVFILYFEKRFKVNKNIKYGVYLFVIILIAFDLLRFAAKWQTFDPKNLVFADVPAIREFQRISGFERAFGNYGAEVSVYYKLPSVEGYDAVYIKKYGEFIASLSDGKLSESARSVVSFPKNGLDTSKAINLLGIKYIVHKISDGQNVWAFPFWKYPNNQFSLFYQDDKYQIYKNNNAYPRAFLVNKYLVENDPQKILNTMFADGFDLRNKIVLSKNPNISADKSFKGGASISKYSPNQVEIRTSSNANSLLFLSDTFYSGWKAYVDNKESEIYLADYTFRAVSVPSGIHTVKFIYDPFSFKAGILVAGFGILLSLFFGVFLLRGKKVLF